MKKLMIGLALTAMVATPALAETYMTTTGATSAGIAADGRYMISDSGAPGYVPYGSYGAPAYGAYAYAPEAGMTYAPPYSVYVNGRYQGSDPDPQVRLNLRRDPPTFMQ
jgi:hypothetical protein